MRIPVRFNFPLLFVAPLILICSDQSSATAEQGMEQEEVQLEIKWYEVTPNGPRLLREEIPKAIPEDIRKSLLQKQVTPAKD